MINLENIKKSDTQKLLMILDEEIDVKCQELKEKKSQLRLQRIFFSSCIAILAAFFIQVFFKLFNMNIISIIIIYQIIALMMFMPLIPNLIKGDVTR